MDFHWGSFLDWTFLFGGLLGAIYLWSTWTFDYFEKRKVPFVKPFPLVGNMGNSLLRIENSPDTINRFYKIFPNDRFVGFFEFRRPLVIIRDPEYIRAIGVKDFDYFTDHRGLIDEHVDPLFGNNLFTLKGQKWKDMRATLSPAFTGSKMKAMYGLISDCAAQMSAHLKKEAEKGPLIFEMKELFTFYTNDVIATTAFGIKVDSFADPTNEFYRMGKDISDFTNYRTMLKFFGYIFIKRIMVALKITLFSKRASEFYRKLVHETMAMRDREGIIRHDMIHLLMQARKGDLKHEVEVKENSKDTGFATVEESEIGTATHKRVWTDDELTAQAVLFFIAGFDTSSTLLSFVSYELATNPDIQTTLQEEIDEVVETQGIPTYDTLQSLKYLDMVISETLRKWPPAQGSDRFCLKPYTIVNTDGTKMEIEKGNGIFFPVMGIHRDPQYYEDPERFNPERFNDENKKNIKPFTYMPFGVGPRNCIGSRFALMEAKAIIFQLLADFTFEVCAKTPIPLVISPKSFALRPVGGCWIGLKQRSSKPL